MDIKDKALNYICNKKDIVLRFKDYVFFVDSSKKRCMKDLSGLYDELVEKHGKVLKLYVEN